ncbi:cuticle protein [Culex quinquefasciatus]|uniref:Cuticle protein n=2 Tax=Culex pipiens complex TaxID=518105 RepID=B0W8Q7_CULQU|nr:adult cuticle protein 1-like [Culex pipiens pallens]EDS39286.1 cuticle protein [Culex quinquefasciatus]|eukprot:XP_001845122.1 cuticle protein [Culex quinquefasciatus]
MKCIAAVVMVALAVAAEASYVPYAHQGYAVAPVVTYAAHHGGPTVVQSNDPHSWAYASAVHHAHPIAPIVSAYNHYDGHNYAGHHIPAAVTYDAGHYYDNHHHGHAAAVIAAPVQHSATYVAANRGAVHKAPLAGHAVNQKSLNLAPAPGTL